MLAHRKVSALVGADVAGATTLLKEFQTAVAAAVDGMTKAGDSAAAAVETTAKAFAPVGNALDATIEGVVRGSIGAGQAASSFGERLMAEELSLNARRLASFVGTEALKTAAAATGIAQRSALEASGAAAGISQQAAAGSASIVNDAHKAAAGAFSAVAGIPYVGPVLAPAAAATAFAGVMAFDVLSAAGGIDRVPFDGMPALLHANESVLPARIAMPLMELATSGPPKGWGMPALPASPALAGVGPAVGAGGGDTVHLHVNNTMSAHGVGADDFAHMALSALNAAVRAGNFQKYPALARAMRRS